jgi:hypothetical protein
MSLTPEETLAKKRQQDCLRFKKWYATHGVEYNKKRREMYAAGKLKNKTPIETHHEPVTPEPQPEPTVVTTTSHPKKIDFEYIKTLIQNHPFKTKNTQKTYLDALNRIHKLFNTDNYLTIYKNPKQTVKTIDESQFAINTKKSLFQTLLFFNTEFKFNIPSKSIDEFKNQFEVYKTKSHDQNQERVENEEVPTLEKYTQDVVNKFGAYSKMHLIVLLAHEPDFTLRDEYSFKVVNHTKEASDEDENYIIIPRGNGRLTVMINNYKTKEKYGKIDHFISTNLSKIIRKYVKDNNIQNGSYLFGTKKITDYISKNNKLLGYSGGTNLLRHIKRSEAQPETAQEKVDLAKKFKHSVGTSANYKRKTKN